MLIVITGSVDTCPPLPPNLSKHTHMFPGSQDLLLALCKRASVPGRSVLGCVCVFSHLQSEQLVGVCSLAPNGDGGLRKGGSWQPEYRHPIQAARSPTGLWRPQQMMVGPEAQRPGLCRLMGIKVISCPSVDVTGSVCVRGSSTYLLSSGFPSYHLQLQVTPTGKAKC